MYTIKNVNRLHIELSSRCNASCPACSRNQCGGPVAPGMLLTELSINDITRMVPVELARNIVSINYCGNIGDPGMAPDLIDILKYFRQHSPNIVQHVRTNGGMRGTNFWTEIGEFFAASPPPKDNHLFSMPGVIFSVDGLEDTNHIYRRGVKWEKLYANMKAYSKTGARGGWEFLQFEHNQHQIEEARSLATELGLAFVVKNPMGFGDYKANPHPLSAYNENGEHEYDIYPAGFSGERAPIEKKIVFDKTPVTEYTYKPELLAFSKSLSNNTKIHCRSLENPDSEEVYISSYSYALPCCFLGGVFGQFGSTYSRWQFNSMIKGYGLEHFSLKDKSLLDILTSEEFSRFFKKGWEDKPVEEGRLLYCAETCGNQSVLDKLYSNKTLGKE